MIGNNNCHTHMCVHMCVFFAGGECMCALEEEWYVCVYFGGGGVCCKVKCAIQMQRWIDTTSRYRECM